LELILQKGELNAMGKYKVSDGQIADKPVFEPIDYIDPEWGAKPTFGQRVKNFIKKLRGEK
jgi:hypothetical protein